MNELAWTHKLAELAHLIRREDIPRTPQSLPRPLTAEQDHLLQQELIRRNDLAGNFFLLLREAMEARDLLAITNALAADAVFHSPLTEKFTFKGREQIGGLLCVILDVFENFHYTDELCDERGGFLVAPARIGGQNIEVVDHMQFGPDGRIRDFTVFFRPLPSRSE